MNTIIVSGRMTKNPVIRQTKSGKDVTSFIVASDRPFLNEEGKRDADFIPVVVYGKAVEAVRKMGYHNCYVLVEGRLQIRTYETAEKEKRWATEIVASRVEFPDHAKTREQADKEKEEKTTNTFFSKYEKSFDLSMLDEAPF